MSDYQDEYTPLLEQIRNTSEALNRAGDEATEQIEALEKRLVDAEPGVAAWGAELITEECELVDEESGESQPAKRTVTVGFGRRKKKWGLMVRDQMLVKLKPRDKEFSVTVSDEVSSLRKADRKLRMLALPHLRGVVEAVLGELQEQASNFLPEAAPVLQPGDEPGVSVEAADAVVKEETISA